MIGWLNMLDKKTDELNDILNFIDNEKDLETYLNQTLSKQVLGLIDYIKELCLSKNIKKSVLIKQADIHRTYAYQILNGTKSPSRDNLIKLCIGDQFSVEETNRILTLGGYNKLYAKDPRDSLITFCINKQCNLIDTNLLLDRHQQLPLGNAE